MSEKDQVYFQHRAEVELAIAQKSTTPEVVRAHYLLSEAYLEKVAKIGSSLDKMP